MDTFKCMSEVAMNHLLMTAIGGLLAHLFRGRAIYGFILCMIMGLVGLPFIYLLPDERASAISETSRNRDDPRGAFMIKLVGFVVGAAIPVVYMWPELAKRWRWAAGGGGGESAAWGEPLFYMFFLGLPAGIVGVIVAAAILRLSNGHK